MISDYILQILKSNTSVFWSWGPHNFHRIDNGLSMKVQGFLFTGTVTVTYDEGPDSFTVRCIKNGVIQKEVSDVYCDSLAENIDRLVEKDCPETEYARNVENWVANAIV